MTTRTPLIISLIREYINDIDPAENVILYGARGEESPESD